MGSCTLCKHPGKVITVFLLIHETRQSFINKDTTQVNGSIMFTSCVQQVFVSVCVCVNVCVVTIGNYK